MNNYLYKKEYSYPYQIMLNVTDDCNLRCRYCFVEQHPHYMNLDTAKAAADWAYQNLLKQKKLEIAKKGQKAEIYFFGGEPTLCFDSIIVPLVEYCQKTYPNNFYFGITTNGTLLNKEKIDFFKNNNFMILLSIDGNKDTQNYNRPCKDNLNSFDLIEKNIPYLLKNFPDLCFRSTIYAPTVKYLFENYLYAESLGFKHYEMIEDLRHDNLWDEKTLNQLHNEINHIYAYRLSQILNNQPTLQVGRISKWMSKTISILNDTNKNFSNFNLKRCGLGTLGCSIGYDGNIYGCQEQTSKNKESYFYIGNIFENGINIQLHNQLLSFYYNENKKDNKNRKNECNNCILKNLCNSNYQICPSTNYDLFKDMNTINNINCEIRKAYYENSFLTLSILSELKTSEEIKKIIKQHFNY